MKNKIKLSILLIPALISVSCRNFFSDDLIERKDSEITVLQGYYSLENNYSARTAIPFPELSTYTFEITAESQETPPADSVDGVIDSAHNSYSIELTEGNWKLTINGYKDAAKTKKALCAENLITIGNSGVTAGSLNFVLQMFQTPLAVSADVLLPIEVTSEISRVEALWKESGIEKKQTIIQNSSSTSGNFTMINDGETSFTAVNGNYDVLFRFYKKIGAAEVIAYSLVEKINLYDYLTTNKWIGNSSSPLYKNGKLVISDNIIKTYDKDIFYVSSSGSDAINSGGFFDPFASVQSAVEIIQAIADPEVEQYTIYLKDNITLAPDYTDWPMQADGVTPEDSYITINPSSSLKIKIASYGEPAAPYSINANRSAANTGRVMYVGEKAEVTLENITITGGCSNVNGAGVFVNSGTLTMNAKSSITQNYLAIAGKSGAGIYCEYGTVIMNTGAEISYNGNTEYLANGGGLYLKGSDTDFTKKTVIKMEPGSKIHHNIGYSGAGLKMLYGSDSYFHGAEITDNEAIYATDDNGGGVWASILSGNSLEITDTILKNNTVNCGTTGGGGAIYVHLGRVVINGTTTFENNSGVTGNAIRMVNSSNQHITLSDSVKFDNTTLKQTIAYDYSSVTEAPYIKLGTLTGTIDEQTVYLTISPLTADNTVLIPESVSVNIADYADRFVVLNPDFTPSNYKIDSNGKLAEKVAKGPNGGNASSEYTVISSVSACGGVKPTTPGVYSISTEEELRQISEWVGSPAGSVAVVKEFEGYTFVLYDNIILTTDWIPIGGYDGTTNMNCFSGTIDGNGNSISGFTYDDSSAQRVGLVSVAFGASIKNLTLEGTIAAKGYASAFIGYSYGDLLIDNCVNKVKIISTGADNTGGFVGYAAGQSGLSISVTIRNCINIGEISGYGSSGGILGATSSAVTSLDIANCINASPVSGTNNYVGGIIGNTGLGNNRVFVHNCISLGVVSGPNSGAVIGKLDSSTTTYPNFDYCYYLNGINTELVGSKSPSYDPSSNILSFTSDGTASTLSTTSDLMAELNSWITDPQKGNDSAYSIYNKWSYQPNGYPCFNNKVLISVP